MIPLAILALLLPQSDTTRLADTTRKAVLPTIEVRVTRAEEQGTRIPMAVGVLSSVAVRRAQLTLGLDESLSRLPGVVVLNRYNYSLDQRVSLRGAGSRANFGLRGVKVLIDGVPQTLPDGQSQLSNLELGLVDRVEVLTGSAGALYGNASGGVLAFSTESPSLPWEARIRASAGSFGTRKWQGVLGTSRGPVRALASLSRFTTDGTRLHSGAIGWQFAGKADADLGRHSVIGVRFEAADAPRAENPGALTAAEYAARSDSAAANNILRGADKSVTQQQLALRYHWQNEAGTEVEAVTFGLLRDLKNPLATPPPPPTSATAGTYNTIDRVVGGLRVSATFPLRRFGAAGVRLTAGVDVQSMRDNRKNQRSTSGAPTGQLLADQRETVRELGPFAEVHWDATDRVLLLGTIRYDEIRFRVTDHLLSDGVDNSGERVMSNPSGSFGASLRASSAATLYANIATSFETPTTTELVNTTAGTAGFNTELGPQQTLSLEAGLRGRLRHALDYSFAAFTSRVHDALIQAKETDGRAFYQNAGKVRNRGIEAGLGVTPWPWLELRGAYSFAHYQFSEYRIPNGATTDTLDGKRLAGVPRHFLRSTLTLSRGPITAEAEELLSSKVFADDRNTQPVGAWAVSSVRLSARWQWAGLQLEPFGAINNLFDKRYVGSVNLNGTFGRILEPAPGRNGYVGMEVSWASR